MHRFLLSVALLACRHSAHAQTPPDSTPPPGALGMSSATAEDDTQPPPAQLEALGAAAVRAVQAGPSRRQHAAALLRAYRNATDRPHEQAWAEAQLEALGVDPEGQTTGARRIGLLVPLSGRLRPVGERLLEGALIAADRAILEIGDTRSDPERAAAEAERLHGVYALVGPAARGELQAVRERARHSPLIPLVAGEALPSGAERAAALLDAALRTNPRARRFAFLAPSGVVGDEMREALRSGGAEIVTEFRYAAGTRQFSEAVAKVVDAAPDGVFVGDTADRLALIAPALAAGGLWPLPAGPPKGAEGRGVLLLASAEGATSRLPEQTGRYLQGAWLAPGFYPDPDDETVGPFVARFSEEYGRAPGPWEAYAYEAVRAAADAENTATLPAWRFGWPLVYRVEGKRVSVAP